MTRSTRAGPLTGVATSLLVPAALAGYTISEQVQMKAEVRHHLVRMGHVSPGPHYAQEMERKADELERAVSSFRDLAMESLSHFLRNPEDDFGECTIAFALGRFSADDPEKTARILVRALPTTDAEGDACVQDALASLGPVAFPFLMECAGGKAPERSGQCLQALLTQSAHLPGVPEALGVDPQAASPDRRAEIRDTAARWRRWWEGSREHLRWDPATRKLVEIEQ